MEIKVDMMEIRQQADLMQTRKQVEKKINTCPLTFLSPFSFFQIWIYASGFHFFPT